jgi:hypothetical protein
MVALFVVLLVDVVRSSLLVELIVLVSSLFPVSHRHVVINLHIDLTGFSYFATMTRDSLCCQIISYISYVNFFVNYGLYYTFFCDC